MIGVTHRGLRPQLVLRFITVGLLIAELGISVAWTRGPVTDPVPPPPADDVYAEARALVEKRKWAEAIVSLQGILRLYPEYPPAAMDLARGLFYLNRREEAVQVLVAMRDLLSKKTSNPERVQWRVRIESMARVLGRQYQKSRAQELVQEGVEALREGQVDAAKLKFKRAVDQESQNAEILFRLGQAATLEGDPVTAVEWFKSALRVAPSEPAIRAWMAHSLHEKGEVVTAIEEWKVAFAYWQERKEEVPEQVLIWSSEAQFELGQTKQAWKNIRDRWGRDPAAVELALWMTQKWSQGHQEMENAGALKYEEVKGRLQSHLENLRPLVQAESRSSWVREWGLTSRSEATLRNEISDAIEQLGRLIKDRKS